MAKESSVPHNESLELGEVERPRDLYEKAMELGYEKMDLIAELKGLEGNGFSEDNEQVLKVKTEISLIDQQLNSTATQWAESKVMDLVKNPEHRAKRVAAVKEHFLARVERKMKRNERKIDRNDKQSETQERQIDRRLDRWEQREERIDARQDARRERRSGRTRASARKQARWEAQEGRIDARQARRSERRQDRMERRHDRREDARDNDTVVYQNAGIGDPGAVWNPEYPSYGYRGDQLREGAQRDADAYGDNSVARRLIEAGLNPAVLTSGGPDAVRAIDIAFSDDPEAASYYKDALSQPKDSLEYQAALEELAERQGELADPYRVLQHGEVARRELEKASLQNNMWGKFTDLVGDFKKNPGALAALGAVGVGLYLLRDKIFTKDVGRVVGGIALAAAGVYTFDFVWEKVDKEHRGLFDRLGFKPSDLLSPDVLSDYRKQYFPSLPQSQRDSVDEMITLFNVPMSHMNDSFERALNNQETSIDPDHFLGDGSLDSKRDGHADGLGTSETGRMDGTDLYRGLNWFYMSCAERAMGRTPRNLDNESKLRLGLEYAKTHFTGMTFKEANYKLNVEPHLRKGGAGVERLAGSHPLPKPTEATFDRHLSFPDAPQLRGLAETVPSAKNVMLGLSSGEVLIKGYPYKVNYSDQKKYVFMDAFDASKVYTIPSNGQAGETAQLLDALTSQSELRVKAQFEKFKGETDAQLEYLESGEWRSVPPLPRMSHAGLNSGSEGISTLLFADGSGFHITFEGAKKDQFFNSLEEMQKAYDQEKVFPTLVERDAGHLLVGVPYKVESITDDVSGKSSTVKISYDGGFEGTLIYKNGVLDSLQLPQSAELSRRQEFEAQKDTVELFSSAKIQDRLVDAKGIYPDVYARWNNMVTEGVVSSEPNIEFNAGVFRTIGKTASEMFDALINSNDVTGDTIAAREKDESEKAMDRELGDLIVKMNTELAELYAKGYPRAKHMEEKKKLMDRYEAEVTTILEKDRDITLTSKDLDTVKDQAGKAMSEALSPMKHWMSTDGNQETLYQERLRDWQQKVYTEIDALFTKNPTPKKSEVDAIVDKYRTQASVQASEHRGLSADQSAEVFSQDKLDGTHHENWEAAYKLAYTYLSNNFKWEQYCFLSKRGNFTDLMGLITDKIDRGNPAATKEQSKKYILNYVLPTIYIKLGGKDDFSMDRFFAQLNTVSDTQYQAAKADLLLMKDYTAWSVDEEVVGVPPELDHTHDAERAKDLATADFMKEFDDHIQLKKTYNPFHDEFWDHKWPEYWRGAVERRAGQIRAEHAGDEAYTAEKYREDLKDYRKFVVMEHNIFQLMVQHRIEPKDKGETMEEIVTTAFSNHWQTRNYVGYFNELATRVYAPDQDWWPEWNDSVIVEAHDGLGLEKLFNVPFI